jgi:hypothetical protein
MIARARALLARYEELWRSRIARLDELLAESPASASDTTTDTTDDSRTEEGA